MSIFRLAYPLACICSHVCAINYTKKKIVFKKEEFSDAYKITFIKIK